jgi:hypothetical protein
MQLPDRNETDRRRLDKTLREAYGAFHVAREAYKREPTGANRAAMRGARKAVMGVQSKYPATGCNPPRVDLRLPPVPSA